ncbi:MAG: hypothetical protein M3Y57_05540 [Acidobacteriota bacterium]|nr:hypothetical protein [Acidobacteriota bacterium]
MQTLISHATEESLEAYALNRAGVLQTEHVEEHLLICERCCIALTALDEEIQVMRLALN